MPRGKKRNPGKNKKRVASRRKEPDIKEWGGYELGQEVWVRMDIYGGVEWAFGAIYEFHPKDKIEPSFSLFDKIRKRYAVGAISKIAKSPPKKWMGKLRIK